MADRRHDFSRKVDELERRQEYGDEILILYMANDLSHGAP